MSELVRVSELATLPKQFEADQRKPLDHIRKTAGDAVQVLAYAHSGQHGILALTDTKLIFAFKPAGLGAAVKTLERDRSNLTAAQIDGADLLVRDPEQLWRFKNVAPAERAAAFLERLHSGGAGESVVEATTGPARSALRIIPEKTRQIAAQLLRPDENVHVVFVGGGGQAMIAADDRMIVIKRGFMAGATLGSKQLDFPYDQITGIELHLGAMTGYIQIPSPAFQANLPGSYWTSDKKHDPWKLPNCIPINRGSTSNLQPMLALVRARIARGHWTDGVGAQPQSEPEPAQALSPPAAVDLAAQLKELAELRDQGVLSDDEFAQAKQKLLS